MSCFSRSGMWGCARGDLWCGPSLVRAGSVPWNQIAAQTYAQTLLVYARRRHIGALQFREETLRHPRAKNLPYGVQAYWNQTEPLSHPPSFETLLFIPSKSYWHTPLNQNYTFCDIRRASKHDLFTHLSVRIRLFTPRLEVPTMAFQLRLSIRMRL